MLGLRVTLERVMTNQYDPYDLGYRRATRIINKMMQIRENELTIKYY